MVQLREKELSSLDFYWQAIKIKQITDSYHIPLIINDRVDIAMAVQADGVHIGQHDIPAAAVRKMIGKDMLHKRLEVGLHRLIDVGQVFLDCPDQVLCAQVRGGDDGDSGLQFLIQMLLVAGGCASQIPDGGQ